MSTITEIKLKLSFVGTKKRCRKSNWHNLELAKFNDFETIDQAIAGIDFKAFDVKKILQDFSAKNAEIARGVKFNLTRFIVRDYGDGFISKTHMVWDHNDNREIKIADLIELE